jgi:hypothetical protein
MEWLAGAYHGHRAKARPERPDRVKPYVDDFQAVGPAGVSGDECLVHLVEGVEGDRLNFARGYGHEINVANSGIETTGHPRAVGVQPDELVSEDPMDF